MTSFDKLEMHAAQQFSWRHVPSLSVQGVVQNYIDLVFQEDEGDRESSDNFLQSLTFDVTGTEECLIV